MSIQDNYTDINSKAWDTWAQDGNEWTIPVSHEEYEKTKHDEWGVYLTPRIAVPKTWFLPFAGAALLGLASGGGQQMPIFKALGANVTIFDNSERQLEAERFVAAREHYEINIIKGDMSKRLPFDDNTFDMIFHPISNCYIEEVTPVWKECYRVLKKDGVLLAAFANPFVFLFDDDDPLHVVNKLPFNPLKNCSEVELKRKAENNEALFFSHSLEEQIGGQLKAGFSLTDIYEDRERDGCGVLYQYTPTYIATRAIKNT